MPASDVKIHAKIIDDNCKRQIEAIANHPAVDGLVAIMPDTHAGAGCVIGFTGRFKDAVIPNVVGVDIGCGVRVEYLHLRAGDIDFKDFDSKLRRAVPMGFNGHEGGWRLSREEYSVVSAASEFLKQNKLNGNPRLQMGTLGGGNHFIEIGADNAGKLILAIHTGSRNFGKVVAEFYQAKAKAYCTANGIEVPAGLEYLPMDEGGQDYLNMMGLAQEYAVMNRAAIADLAMQCLPTYDLDEQAFDCAHNFIDDGGMVRKGAIWAYEWNSVAIPLNMAAGIVIGKGKGNPDYNCSAPHGAGRLAGRGEMRRKLESGEVTMEMFKEKMDGIFSTSVTKDTIDESPFAYKAWEDIQAEVEETVVINNVYRPVYNAKA